MGASHTYLVCAQHRWNIENYKSLAAKLPGEWHLVTERESLTPELVGRLKPRFIFFPHWSSIVPAEIVNACECVCFHMTDVPYGRGGSPLQNLIVRGHTETKLTALRMTDELDAGPVYFKRALSLAGRAQDIYERASAMTFEMIEELVAREPRPEPQQGEVVRFERRRPEQSQLPTEGDPSILYDHIRMLDADGYPHAFARHGDFMLVFSDAELKGDRLEARVTIKVSKD